MKNIVLTITALIMLLTTSFAANLDARFIYKGDDEKRITVSLPEVVIQEVRKNNRMEKVVFVNGEPVVIHYLPAVEITGERMPDENSVMKEIRQIKLPEVVIEASATGLNYQTAQVIGNDVVPVVQLNEVTVIANANQRTALSTSDEWHNKEVKSVFNVPGVTIEIAMLSSVILFLMSIIFPAAG